MHLLFRLFSRKPKLHVYKIWLENDGNPIPQEYVVNLNRRKPREAEVILWFSQEATRSLLSKHRTLFPKIFDLFWAPNTSPVMRSDMLRLLILYDRGGLYSDHDIAWGKKNLNPGHDFIAWVEFVNSDETVKKNMETTREFRGDVPEYPIRIANYVLWSRRPESPILARCLKRIEDRLGRNSHLQLSQYGVLYNTGPDVMTDILVEGLPEPNFLHPFEKCEYHNTEWIDCDGESVLLLGRQPGRTYAHHETHGAWRAAHDK